MTAHTVPASSDTPTITLSHARAGQMVELVGIEGGRRLRKRLADLGLITGRPVRVVQNRFAGPLILAIHVDSRLAVGRGMARKITVRVLEG